MSNYCIIVEGERRTLSIQELKTHTRVTDSQLNCQIQEKDFQILSVYFDNVETYLAHLRLNSSQQTDIKDLALRRGTQVAMIEALRLWREPNPYTATYRVLVEILLDLKKGELAVRVCEYLISSKGEYLLVNIFHLIAQCFSFLPCRSFYLRSHSH